VWLGQTGIPRHNLTFERAFSPASMSLAGGMFGRQEYRLEALLISFQRPMRSGSGRFGARLWGGKTRNASTIRRELRRSSLAEKHEGLRIEANRVLSEPTARFDDHI